MAKFDVTNVLSYHYKENFLFWCHGGIKPPATIVWSEKKQKMKNQIKFDVGIVIGSRVEDGADLSILDIWFLCSCSMPSLIPTLKKLFYRFRLSAQTFGGP